VNVRKFIKFTRPRWVVRFLGKDKVEIAKSELNAEFAEKRREYRDAGCSKLY
jgi:hypothetical protein